MGKGRSGIQKNEIPVFLLIVLSFYGMAYLVVSIITMFPTDCGRPIHLWRGHTAYPPLSREEFLVLAPNCSLSPLAVYSVHPKWIRAEHRPCRAEHVLNAYPPPVCKSGIRRAVYLKHRKVYVTAQSLCCYGIERGQRHASVYSKTNKTNARNDGEL
jgi:hypothetical protein